MPVNAAAWSTLEYISAKKLNTDLYNYQPGNAFTPNGILFHAQRPTLLEYITSANNSFSASTPGSWYSLTNPPSGVNWVTAWDSSAYYGPGMDAPFNLAEGAMKGETLGANGIAEIGSTVSGGWYLVGGHLNSQSGSAGTMGIGLAPAINTTVGNVALIVGQQNVITNHDNCAYGFDLVTPGLTASTPQPWSIGSWIYGSSNILMRPTSPGITDWSGETSRLFALWTSIAPANNTGGIPTAPVPLSTVTGVTDLTSAALTSGISNVLNFLNMPPALRVSTSLTTSITANTTTTVPLSTTSGQQGFQLDAYSGWSNTTHTYTVPVSGVYLVHGCVAYNGSGLSSFQQQTGVLVNGTTQLWGPSYQSLASGTAGFDVTMPTITRLLDLQAGDTILLNTRTNASGATPLAAIATPPTPCRLLVQWMGALSTASNLTWTPPDTGFRWQAGTPGSQLVSQFNAHIVNDLNFLINKPYLMAHQTTAVTGITGGNSQNLVMQSDTPLIHGASNSGDNYGGYNTTTGIYTAQVAGWYWVVGEYTIATATAPYPIVAQVNAPGPGVPTYQQNSLYWGQHINTTDGSSTEYAGATYVNLHYLRVGDTIQPAAMVQPASGTWGTSLGAGGQNSTFGLVWVSQ